MNIILIWKTQYPQAPIAPKVAIAIALFVLLSSPTSVIAAGEYTRLVPSDPLLPPAGPRFTEVSSGTRWETVLMKAFGQGFNAWMVSKELKHKFVKSVADGLALAKAQGQTGVLLRVQVVAEPTPGGQTFHSLRNGLGVDVVGVGPDANAVCFTAQCWNRLEQPLRGGQQLASGSGYFWASCKGNRCERQVYGIEALEQHAQHVMLNERGRQEMINVTRARVLDGYAARLRETAQNQQERRKLDELIKGRERFAQEQAAIETELSRELRKAERAAQTSRTLNLIAAAFNLASAVAMANYSTGENLTSANGGPITSMDDLQRALHALHQRSQNSSTGLMTRLRTVRDQKKGLEMELLEIGTVRNVRPQVP